MVELLYYKEVKDGLQNNFGGLTLIIISSQECEMARSQMEDYGLGLCQDYSE
jgi:hypothetical protein